MRFPAWGAARAIMPSSGSINSRPIFMANDVNIVRSRSGAFLVENMNDGRPIYEFNGNAALGNYYI